VFQHPESPHIPDTTYGVIGATQVDPRQLQFGLKYVF